MQFRQHQIVSSEDERIIATLFVDSAGQRSLNVFEFEDGQVRREWEFLLGPGADWGGDVVVFRYSS